MSTASTRPNTLFFSSLRSYRYLQKNR